MKIINLLLDSDYFAVLFYLNVHEARFDFAQKKQFIDNIQCFFFTDTDLQ